MALANTAGDIPTRSHNRDPGQWGRGWMPSLLPNTLRQEFLISAEIPGVVCAPPREIGLEKPLPLPWVPGIVCESQLALPGRHRPLPRRSLRSHRTEKRVFPGSLLASPQLVPILPLVQQPTALSHCVPSFFLHDGSH